MTIKKVVCGVFFFLILTTVSWAGPTQEVSVIARRFEYLPNKIEVVKGVPVRLYLTSLDTTHGFYLEKFKVNQQIEKGKLTIVDFVPDTAGEFEIRCSVFCGVGHMGMTGKLVVVEPPPHQEMTKEKSGEGMMLPNMPMPMPMHMH
ncbi:MAG: cupredoxin domain-containing protein [bacterium]|nr:cupredoxin domain-containing protein [bacterium]